MAYLLEILPSLLNGLQSTLGVFFVTLIGSIPLGILVSLGLRSEFFTIRWLLNGYIWIMRGTPLLLQLIFIYYGLGMMGISFPRFEAAVIAFIINYAAYLAEIFRGGLQSVPKGQYD
ncbi:MAG: ABC transporter permease subunit, partial [Leuconostoc fallax]